MILSCFVFVCLAFSARGMKLHEHMTKEEIESTFNVDHKLVHEVEYEVAPVLHVDGQDSEELPVRRSRSAVHLRAFNTNFSLNLLENDNTLLGSKASIYMAYRDSFEIKYRTERFPMPDNLKLYHDMRNRAALTVFKDEQNNAHLYGSIGDDYVIKPIPARLQEQDLPNVLSLSREVIESLCSFWEDYGNDPFFQNFIENDPFLKKCPKPTLNIVIKNPQVYSPNYPAPLQPQAPQQWPPATVKPFNYGPISQFPVFPQSSSQFGDPAVVQSDVVYPRLLVAVDHETYVAHGRNINELSKYMAAFWNAVDLRFRELSRPQIRLNIAGLVVPEEPWDAPYFEQSTFKIENLRNVIYDGKALWGIANYFNEKQDQISKSTFNIAVGITHRDMGFVDDEGKLQLHSTGIAFRGGACTVNACAVFRDKGGFNGITTAAHELAHTMGARHDRDVKGNLCPEMDGFLMTYHRVDSRGVHWSECSKRALSKFLSSPKAYCLKDEPSVGTPYPKILPGKILSRDEQCARNIGANWYSDIDRESNCAVLWCRRPLSALRFNLTTQYRPPAEGSYCGEGAICLDAKCVKEPKYLYHH